MTDQILPDILTDCALRGHQPQERSTMSKRRPFALWEHVEDKDTHERGRIVHIFRDKTIVAVKFGARMSGDAIAMPVEALRRLRLRGAHR
jgi:hypothetical protein